MSSLIPQMFFSRKDVKLSLKVMVNKEKNKVLYAVADNHFTDILLSFLTLPLGRVVRVLEKHYGDKAPSIGSLSTLYRSIASLDTSHFVTDGAKNTLLNPRSSFEDEYKQLRLDISDFQPAEYFRCTSSYSCDDLRVVSVYYDALMHCQRCRRRMYKEAEKKVPVAPSGNGVLTLRNSSFTISDDLKIFPNEMGFVRIIATLGIAEDACKAEEIQVQFGLDEMMKLLKASLTSPTPLSDVVLNKTTQMKYSSFMELQPKTEKKEEDPEPKRLSLKVIMQKSSGKLLYAEAKEDFVEFLFGTIFIPIGGSVHLLGGKSRSKAINNLHQTTSELMDAYFERPGTKNRLINPNLPHGCMSENYIIPLTEECLPAEYISILSRFSSVKFPKGKGTYLLSPRTYMVTDNLTVAPFCAASILSTLNKLEIPVSDVEEVELQIGLKEGLSILKASLASTTTLTDALLAQISEKRVKREV